MAKKRYTVAVDLGQSSVIVAAGYKDEAGKLQIAAISKHRSEGIKAGRIENIAHVNIALSKCIAEIESRLHVKLQLAYGGISGELVIAHQHRERVNVSEPENGVSMGDISMLHTLMERVKPSDRDALLESLPLNYKIDNGNEVTNPVGTFGHVLSSEFNFVVCEKEALGRVSRAFTLAGITLKRCFANSVVAAEAVLTYDERDNGVALVDLGDGVTNVTIYYRGTLRYIGSIPIGESAINNDLRSLMIQERSIEQIKRDHGVAIADGVEGCVEIEGRTPRESRKLLLYNLAAVIESRMLDIIDFVEREIRDANYADKLTYGLVLSGGGAKLALVDRLFERQLKMPVRIAIPEDGIGDESLDAVSSPEYATVVGLLKRGVEMDDKGVGKSCTVEIVAEESATADIGDIAAAGQTPYQQELRRKDKEAEAQHDSHDSDDGDDEPVNHTPPFLRSVTNTINSIFGNQGRK
ncbi:MAG: cell division protein FtsA [Rikenellaceae bacterium]